MAQDIDALLPDVLTFAPNCAEPLAYRFIREAAAEFCERTRAWREPDEFQVSTPDCEGICTVPDAKILFIEAATLGGVDLVPVTVGWLDNNMQGWMDYTDTGAAKYVTQLTSGTLTVVPKVSGLLRLRLVLAPSRSAQTLPDFLVDRYATEIAKGAAGRVLITPDPENPAGANPQLGLALLGEFQAALDRFSIQVTKGQQGARLRTRGRYL